MARIVVGSYMVRYPLGGMMSYVLQYLVGFTRLGHDVWFVELADYPQACFDPSRNLMTDDCTYGTAAVDRLLSHHGLGDRWCFVDATGEYHGTDRAAIESVCRSADVFVDMGTHGAWLDEVPQGGIKVLLDGEPGYNQIRLAGSPRASRYDRFFTNGLDVGTPRSSAPTAGREWGHLPHPVVTDLFDPSPPPPDAPFTTIMNWQSHPPIEHEGRTYGQKDVEFEKFADLPTRFDGPLELAVAGTDVPWDRLAALGWRLRDAHAVTTPYETFGAYLAGSAGEFGVCKNVFVELRTGWFSDRSAAYLAMGRPVVLQDTGFSGHLPVGQGLHAVASVDEAAAALEAVQADYAAHARAAREIAVEHLEATTVLARFLEEVGTR